jgi:cytochrome c oxidase subunit 4
MEKVHTEPNYMAVFYWLGVLTIAELVVIYLPISKLVIGALLVLLALSKASLVALYYMHLKFEKRTLGAIALTPLIICALLVFSLLPDLTTVHHRTRATTSQAIPAGHK